MRHFQLITDLKSVVVSDTRNFCQGSDSMRPFLIIAFSSFFLSSKAWALCPDPLIWPSDVVGSINELNNFIECKFLEIDQRLTSIQDALDNQEVEGGSREGLLKNSFGADPEVNLDHIQDIWRGERHQERDIIALQRMNEKLLTKIEELSKLVGDLEELHNENEELKQRQLRLK